MKQRLSKEVSQRVWITRYLMIIGVVIIHIPTDVPMYLHNGALFSFVKAFFAHAVFKAAVPMLMSISGFFVFYFGLQKYPLKLLNKKSISILLPLILWNLPFAIFIYILQKYNLIQHHFSYELYPVELVSWFNAVLGVTQLPVNLSLHFLRDLYVISLLSPVLWLLLKKIPYIGFVVIWVVYYFNLDGALVMRNSMLLSFYIGALAASQNWSLTSLDKFAAPLFSAFIIFCIAIVYFKIENLEVFRFAVPFMVWPAMSLLSNTMIGDWLLRNSDTSFFTFLSHGPIAMVTLLIYKSVAIDMPYFIYWVLCPVVSVLLALWLHRIFVKLLPEVASVMLGGR